MSSFFIGLTILFISGIIATMFPKKLKITVLSILSVIASILCLKPALYSILHGEVLFQTFGFNNLFGTVNFIIDPLSAFFVALISIMAPISLVYSKGYLEPYVEKGKNINPHLVLLPVLVASMLAVVTCQNAFMFLICWEIMSLSSFFLVIFENEKKDVLKAGIKYLIFMHISVLFIMIAFALLSIKTGNFDFISFAYALREDHHFANIIFILLFIGFGAKAGFVPFHNWLPDAHPAAPSHVSAMMSGVMIKTGIYGIFRVLSMIGEPSKSIAYTVLIISLMSALYGVLYTIIQQDMKKMLAYSTIENVGIIGLGMGVGMLGLAYHLPIIAILGFAGSILHIFNHSIFKELLFLAAGSVYTKAHSRNIELLGGLIKPMPKTAVLFLIGSLAICGLPPFNGFISELLIYFGMFKSLSINNFFALIMILFAIAGLALVGTMALLCFSKIFSVIFLGMPRSEAAEHVKDDCGLSMILPMCLLGSMALAIGISPVFAFGLVLSPVSVFVNVSQYDVLPVLSLMGVVTLFAFAFLLFVGVLIFVKIKLTKGRIDAHETWGCGYNRANNHMQYTASSYASPFLSMLNPLFKKVFDIEKPKKLFPKSAHFSMHAEDIEEAYVIEPVVKSDEWFLSKFEGLQNGNIQSYIKYGLIFLLIVIIGCLFI